MSDSNEFAWSLKRDLQMMLSTLETVALWKDNGEKDKEYQKLVREFLKKSSGGQTVAMLRSILSSEEILSLMVKKESSEDNNVNEIQDQQQQEQQHESPNLLDDGVVNNEWNITGESSASTVVSQASASFTEEFWRNMSQEFGDEVAQDVSAPKEKENQMPASQQSSSSSSSSQCSSTIKSMASILRQRKRPNLRRSTRDKSGTEEDADEIDVIETSVITAEVHANPDQFSSESSIGDGDDFTPPLTKSPRKDKVKREITYDATTTTQKPRRRRELSFNKENPNNAVENEEEQRSQSPSLLDCLEIPDFNSSQDTSSSNHEDEVEIVETEPDITICDDDTNEATVKIIKTPRKGKQILLHHLRSILGTDAENLREEEVVQRFEFKSTEYNPNGFEALCPCEMDSGLENFRIKIVPQVDDLDSHQHPEHCLICSKCFINFMLIGSDDEKKNFYHMIIDMHVKGIHSTFVRAEGNSKRIFSVTGSGNKKWLKDLSRNQENVLNNSFLSKSTAFKVSKGKLQLHLLPAAKCGTELRKKIRNNVQDKFVLFIKVDKSANCFHFKLRDVTPLNMKNSNTELQTSMTDFYTRCSK